MNSSLGKLKLNDFAKGLLITVLTAVLTVIYQSVSADSLVVNWNVVLTTGLTAGIAYLLKNIGTGENGRILTNAPPKTPLPK